MSRGFINSGRTKFGNDWFGTGGYAACDAFAKHFAQHCRELPNKNAVKAWLKENVEPTILWQGDRIRCMKSSRTLQCKICMMERKEILKHFQEDKSSVINDNSDIFSSCKCRSRFHKFFRNVETTLRTRLTQKKVPSVRRSKMKRKGKQFFGSPKSPVLCQPVSPGMMPVSSPEPASPPVTPVLFDTNVPGLPPRSPTMYPTNLELAQVRHFIENQPVFEV